MNHLSHRTLLFYLATVKDCLLVHVRTRICLNSVKMASFLRNIITLPYSPLRQHTDRLAESDMDDEDNDNDSV